MLQLLGPSTGGIRRVVGALTEGLEARQWRVVNVGPVGVLAGVTHQEAVVPVGLGSLLRGRRALRRLLADADFDVVHAHGLTAGWVAKLALAGRGSSPRLVVSVHNLVLDEAAGRLAPVLRWMEGRLPGVVDVTVAISPEVARRFTGRRGASQVRVIPPAVAAPVPQRSRHEVRHELGLAEGVGLVVSVARLHPQKDLPTLVRAAAGLEEQGVRAVVVVIGEGPAADELAELVDELGLTSRVRLVGSVFDATDHQAAADVVVVSSRWESGPLAALEAMALGRPLVSTPVGLVPDVVVDGVSGRLVAVGDHVAMAEAVAWVLADRDRAEALGGAGRVAVAARMGVDAQAAATEAVYEEVLGW